MEHRIYSIGDLPVTSLFEGYLWLSNASKPEVYLRDRNIVLPSGTNPFIAEGNLFDETNQKSWSIRFMDGLYIVNCFNLEELKDKTSSLKEYLPNRFPGKIRRLCFREFWMPVPDDLCENMEVLKPSMSVFVGFKIY